MITDDDTSRDGRHFRPSLHEEGSYVADILRISQQDYENTTFIYLLDIAPQVRATWAVRDGGSDIMDEIDERLIALLKEDSRTPNVQLAEEIGTTEGTVRARLKRLSEDGTIRSFTIRTATRNIKALVEVQIEVNVHTSQIARQIMDMSAVEAVYEVAGNVDIIAVVDVMTMNELNDVIEEIRSHGSIIATQTKMVLNEL